MSTVYADGNTIVGDDHFADHLKPSGNNIKDVGPRAGTVIGKSVQPKSTNDFVATTDYTLEERSFFVPIGKNGLISALEKLDQQLIQVCLTTRRVTQKSKP